MLLLPFNCMVPTSKRGVFVMLNVSQVNLTTCLSVMFQLLLMKDGIVAPLSRLEEDPRNCR
jgi:hypothetical protein